MVSFKSALVVFAAASSASAELWGWPEKWEMVSDATKDLWGTPVWKVCEGFGNECGKCSGVQEFAHNGWRNQHNFSWGLLKHNKRAWIDMWQENSVSYNLYENGKGSDGVLGKCEIADAVWWKRKCGDKPVTVRLRCWKL